MILSLVVLVSMSGRLTLLVLIGLPIASLITFDRKSLKRSTDKHRTAGNDEHSR